MRVFVCPRLCQCVPVCGSVWPVFILLRVQEVPLRSTFRGPMGGRLELAVSHYLLSLLLFTDITRRKLTQDIERKHLREEKLGKRKSIVFRDDFNRSFPSACGLHLPLSFPPSPSPHTLNPNLFTIPSPFSVVRSLLDLIVGLCTYNNEFPAQMAPKHLLPATVYRVNERKQLSGNKST